MHTKCVKLVICCDLRHKLRNETIRNITICLPAALLPHLNNYSVVLSCFLPVSHGSQSVSLVCTFLFFPVSIVRTAVNRKIGAPVCWVQMSAPAVCLYGLSIMAQPSTDIGEEKLLSNTANMEFYRIHRKIYMPVMHFFFLLCMIGMLSAVHSLIVRWKDFRRKEFSPAHASLCAPLLSHVNALQAYRSVVDKFSFIPVGSPFKV